MEYKKAAELKGLFEVHGHFYDLAIGGSLFPCRSALLIQRRSTSTAEPDAVMVMMNPGSSRPMDNEVPLDTRSAHGPGWNGSKHFIPAKPDATQYQIMRLMDQCAWNCVRVINLSDLCNGNSSEFIKEYQNAAALDKSSPHCLLHPYRNDEMREAMRSSKGIVIAAWGRVQVLSDAAYGILDRYPQVIGSAFEKPYYRHARPMLKSGQLEWLEKIKEALKGGVSNNLEEHN